MIRAVAVLSVFFGHLYTHWHSGSASITAWHFAQMGVLIFFVHTSLVLMLSLERAKLKGGQLFGAFYLRRAFRIYPLSMACVTMAMLVAVGQSGAVRHWTLGEYASNMALTTNLTYTTTMVGGLWTLPLEVQMYLLLPVLFLIGRHYSTRVMVALWVVAIPIAYIQPQLSGRLNVFGYVPCFLSGVLAWKLSLRLKRRFNGWFWPLAFIATWPVFLVASHDNSMPYRWAFCAVLGFVIPWFEEMPRGPLYHAAHAIATYSYGIYLTHIAAIAFAFSRPVSTAVQWAIFTGLAVALPAVAYHGIEQPMISIGQRISRHLFAVRTETVQVPALPIAAAP